MPPGGTDAPAGRHPAAEIPKADEGIRESLARFPLFADLSPKDLHWLARAVRRMTVPGGSVLFQEGTPGDRFYVILQGEFEVTRAESGRTAVLNILGPGDFLSEMSILEDMPRSASARAVTDGEVFALEPEDFKDLLARSPGAALAMLRTVTARLRSTESALIAHGRMAGLGTLAEGLAHELNNPAAAIVRSTDLLARTLREGHRRCAELGALPLAEPELEALRNAESSLFAPPEEAPSSRGTAGGERDLEAWLANLGIPEAWELAPPLGEAGWTPPRLEELRGAIAPGHLEPVLRLVAAGAEASTLVREIREAGRAIAGIVSSVRSYSSPDGGLTRGVDVGESLAGALSILRGRLGEGITVVQDIQDRLPAVEANPGELSQVWVNLLANALDAMGGEGTLRIRARGTEGGIVVVIQDTGSGIPPEVRPRIFDPFFTTKPQGEGTGLGLPITYGIVVNRYRGNIRVDSRPGRTLFEVALPALRSDPGMPSPGS